MRGAPRTPEIVRRRPWLVLAAALVPLLVLLVLQMRWLERLERVSAVAEQATLENYVGTVVATVELRYRALGERALNLPAAVFTPERLHKTAYHFAKKDLAGARTVFVVSFTGERAGQPFVYDPATRSLVEPEWSEEMRAIYVAVAPWKVLAMKGGDLERPTLHVEERDAEHRMILNPVTDDAGRIVGLAGMIVDPDYFERVVLPETVADALPEFFGGDRRQAPVVTVRDAAGDVFCSGAADAPAGPTEASRPFGFLFRDHTVDIHGRHATAADWTRRNFAINLGISVLLIAVVAGGVLFALRAAAREMRLSQMKSDFVSNVSHELRTPLASIRVFGELLRLGRVESPEKVREYGEYIETESRRLTQLIANILDLARIESGRKSYRLEAGDLEAVVAETLRTFKVSLSQNGFRILYRPSPEPLPPMLLDGQAIAQSLGNLLDNAVKYSGEARDIEVGVRRDGDEAVVWVSDQGIGIPREELGKVFERFHRVSTGLVHDVKGSGLGLAIVRHVIEAHGGRVGLESRPGAGSTFSLHLPIPGGAALPAASPAPAGGRPSEA